MAARSSASADGHVSASVAVLAFARLSTSTKMLLILTVALLPLGLIASLASIEAAHSSHQNRVLAAHLLAGDSADRLGLFLDRASAALRGAEGRGSRTCRRAAEMLGGGDTQVAYFSADGRRDCAGPRLAGTAAPEDIVGSSPVVSLAPGGDALRLALAVPEGSAVAEIPRAVLAQASHPNAVDGSYGLRLTAADGRVLTLGAMRSLVLGRDIVTDLAIAGGQLSLTMTVEAAPLGATELLLLLLPILMWAAAAAIGWTVVDRLLIRPLETLERAITESQARGGRLVVPETTTPAHEIRSLRAAMISASGTIARHEAELEEGLARQTRLTREVHHRVKNNLQVIASLLNIHARGATTPEAADAYAAIQRRVDALALVHRNHYAELEVSHGLALRPLIGELCASLRASMPRTVRSPAIMLDIEQVQVNQDVAVALAFLVTELVEVAMLRVPGTTITVSLATTGDGRARLSVCSAALGPDAAAIDDDTERSQRVVVGLSRQLRSTLERDEEAGAFAVAFAVLPER